MDKKQLLEFVNSLPDDLYVEPFDLRESKDEHEPWVSQNKDGVVGRVHRKTVHSKLTLRLNFKSEYEGEFKRKLNELDGNFFNVHRVN